mgnify:CR=1 FL=1
MKKFVTVHVIACLTKQDIQRLVERFYEASDDRVRNHRVWADNVSGRMVCEWSAVDRETLVAWLEDQNVRLRGESEWVIQAQLEAIDGILQHKE